MGTDRASCDFGVPQLIDSLGLAGASGWSNRALFACLSYLAQFAELEGDVVVVDAKVRDETTFHVVYRLNSADGSKGLTLGSVGDRDPAATLRLMPHIEPHEVPLDAERYGAHFGIVAVVEPFGPEEYTEPDHDGVRWFIPPDFRQRRNTARLGVAGRVLDRSSLKTRRLCRGSR